MSDTNNDYIALVNAIERLRVSNFILGTDVEKSGVESQELLDYLTRGIGEDSERDKELENKIKAAVYLSIRKIKWKPRFTAKKIAEATVHAMRDARLSYLYDTDKISAKQYKEQCESNFVTNTVNVYKRFQAKKERWACKTLMTAAIAATVGGPAGLIAGGVMLATELIPPSYREKIKRKTKEIARKAGETIVQTTKKLYKKGKKVARRVADKMVDITQNVVQATATYARPIVDTAREVVRGVVDTVKETASKVKQKAKKLWSWLTT